MKLSWKWRSGRERVRMVGQRFSGLRGEMPTTFGDYESIAGEHHRYMVVPTWEAPSFVVVEAELSFQVLIGSLDTPTLHDEAHELLGGSGHLGHGHEEVIRWFGLMVA